MKRRLLFTLVGLVSVAATVGMVETRLPGVHGSSPTAVFDSNGRLQLPTGYRRWVFVGAPLTPNGLNNEKAGFPEYHHVYIEERNLDVYLRTGSFPEGTVIVKELTRLLDSTFPDGSRTEHSGRGYFNGQFNGLDVTVKDSKRLRRPTVGASSTSDIIPCRMPSQLTKPLQANVPAAMRLTSPKRT